MPVNLDPERMRRARGVLLGLAIGDALGTTLAFSPPLDPFTPYITRMVGGGTFGLPAGGWTNDTSMALCLAQSLIATGVCDPHDQMERYVRWWKNGENSITGRCFDIGNTTRAALQRYLETGNPLAGDLGLYAAATARSCAWRQSCWLPAVRSSTLQSGGHFIRMAHYRALGRPDYRTGGRAGGNEFAPR
ncbi:MAG: ADP-ribosylglycohydrolase family protein [Roseiflexaceae bacterium]|nr:ADP-ribosylglycohydrolase family protein [Roseiflexus sp.]MDW8213449.1 ADP-ribosylglycohydrolase family protein [Roseiflexaceae bacterium]